MATCSWCGGKRASTRASGYCSARCEAQAKRERASSSSSSSSGSFDPFQAVLGICFLVFIVGLVMQCTQFAAQTQRGVQYTEPQANVQTRSQDGTPPSGQCSGSNSFDICPEMADNSRPYTRTPPPSSREAESFGETDPQFETNRHAAIHPRFAGTPFSGPEFRPDWVEQPPPNVVSRFYPERAERRGQDGSATLNCLFPRNRAAPVCEVRSEAPEGWQFGEAARRMSRSFRATSSTEFEEHFQITVRFAMPDDE